MRILITISVALFGFALLATADRDVRANEAIKEQSYAAFIEANKKLNDYAESYTKKANESQDLEEAAKYTLASLLVSSINTIYEQKMEEPLGEIWKSFWVTRDGLDRLVKARFAASAEIDGRFERLIKVGSELNGDILKDAVDIIAHLSAGTKLVKDALDSFRD